MPSGASWLPFLTGLLLGLLLGVTVAILLLPAHWAESARRAVALGQFKSEVGAHGAAVNHQQQVLGIITYIIRGSLYKYGGWYMYASCDANQLLSERIMIKRLQTSRSIATPANWYPHSHAGIQQSTRAAAWAHFSG